MLAMLGEPALLDAVTEFDIGVECEIGSDLDSGGRQSGSKRATHSRRNHTMKRITTMIALTVLLSAGNAQAWAGDKLLALCSAPQDSVDKALCVGWLTGLSHATRLSGITAVSQSPSLQRGFQEKGVVPHLLAAITYCPTHDTTIEQELDVVVKFLRENPAKRKLQVEYMALFALAQEWRCPGDLGTMLQLGMIVYLQSP